MRVVEQISVGLTDAQSLTTILTIEGFLLATVSLALALATPGRRRPISLPVAPSHVALGAAVLSVLVGAAGVGAWIGIYGFGELLPPRQVWIAVTLLVAVVFQPVIAFLLALGARSGN